MKHTKLLVGSLLALALLAGCGKSIETQALRPAVLLEPVHCVAVMPFENLTSYPRAGDIVADFFATELYTSKRFRIVERMQVQQAARTINLRIPSRISAEFARQMGERLQVDGVFFGSVHEYWYPNTAGSQQTDQVLKGDEPAVGISAKLIAVDTGEVLWSASASRSSYDMMADQRDPVSRISQIVIADLIEPLRRELVMRQIDLLQICGVTPSPLDGRFHGRIVEKGTQQPVPNANMLITEPREVRVQVNAASGEYLTPALPAGTARYTAAAEGYESADGAVQVLSNENISQDVELVKRAVKQPKVDLDRPGVLGGRVLDTTGLPVAARVRLDPDPGVGILETDGETGRFRREVKSGSYIATVTAEGFKPREKAVQLQPGQNFFMEVTLESAKPKDDEKARLEKDRIVLTEQVHFQTGSNNLHESSYPILLQVVQILKAHPEIKKVQVEGHSDDVGGALINQRLSQQRAQAVVDFLVRSGVEAGRVSALGFGEAVPIADNATPEGRARNRRVEFTILERSDR